MPGRLVHRLRSRFRESVTFAGRFETNDHATLALGDAAIGPEQAA
jgi:hypothetical protein